MVLDGGFEGAHADDYELELGLCKVVIDVTEVCKGFAEVDQVVFEDSIEGCCLAF